MNLNKPPKRYPLSDAALFVVLLTLSEGVCYLLWAWSKVIAKFAAYSLGGRPLPNLTSFLFEYRFYLLLVPVPWLLHAIYSFGKGPRSPHQLISFSATLLMAILFVAMVTVTALVMPWIFIPGGHPAWELQHRISP